MSRSRRKPVAKLDNDRFFKKHYNRKLRRKNITLHSRSDFKKLNCKWNICDFNAGVLSKEYVEKWYTNETKHQLTMK